MTSAIYVAVSAPLLPPLHARKMGISDPLHYKQITKEDSGAHKRARSLANPEEFSLEEGLLAHQEEDHVTETKDTVDYVDNATLVAAPLKLASVEREAEPQALITIAADDKPS